MENNAENQNENGSEVSESKEVSAIFNEKPIVKDIVAMNKPELIEKCENLGLSAEGNKPDLLNRIQAYYKSNELSDGEEVNDVVVSEDVERQLISLTTDGIDKEIEEAEASLKKFEEHAEKQAKLEKLQEQYKQAKLAEKKFKNITTKCHIDFTPEEIEYFSQYDACFDKKLVYLCYLVGEPNKKYLNCAGQVFIKEVTVRTDGYCPACQDKSDVKAEAKRPIFYAGQTSPRCHICGGVLQFAEKTEEQTMKKMRQRYVTLTGDAVFRIAVLSHEQTIELKTYHKDTREILNTIERPIADFIRVSRIRVDENNEKIVEKRVDLKRMYQLYRDTCESDSKGEIIVSGKKQMFYLENEDF